MASSEGLCGGVGGEILNSGYPGLLGLPEVEKNLKRRLNIEIMIKYLLMPTRGSFGEQMGITVGGRWWSKPKKSNGTATQLIGLY